MGANFILFNSKKRIHTKDRVALRTFIEAIWYIKGFARNLNREMRVVLDE
jgi:hypothetical protein